jgi:hypothetical protein
MPFEYGPVTVVNAARDRDRSSYVYVGRAWAGFPLSKWGNPFKGNGAIEKYRLYLNAHPHLVIALADELEQRGLRTIACWCKPQPCHGDVLAEHVELFWQGLTRGRANRTATVDEQEKEEE